MQRMFLLSAVSLTLLLTACGEEEGGGTAHSLSFILENGGDAPIYTQLGSPSGGWLSVSDSSGPLGLSLGCSCPCDTPADQCAVCDAIIPTADPIAAGGEKRLDWDGKMWEIVQRDGRRCAESSNAPAGDYDVTFCWGRGAFELSNGESWLTASACHSQTVALGTDTEVRHTVTETGPEPAGFTLILENSSLTDSRFVQASEACDGSPGWFRILTGPEDALEPLDLQLDCNLCWCARGPECTGGCDEFCMQPQVRELAPGQTIQYVWSGLEVVERNLSSSWTCTDYEALGAGEQVTVEVCFGAAANADGTLVDSPVCVAQPVTLGASTSEVIIVTDQP